MASATSVFVCRTLPLLEYETVRATPVKIQVLITLSEKALLLVILDFLGDSEAALGDTFAVEGKRSATFGTLVGRALFGGAHTSAFRGVMRDETAVLWGDKVEIVVRTHPRDHDAGGRQDRLLFCGDGTGKQGNAEGGDGGLEHHHGERWRERGLGVASAGWV